MCLAFDFEEKQRLRGIMVTLQIRGFIYCTLNQISEPVVLFTIFNFNSRICRAFLLVHSFFFFFRSSAEAEISPDWRTHYDQSPGWESLDELYVDDFFMQQYRWTLLECKTLVYTVQWPSASVTNIFKYK